MNKFFMALALMLTVGITACTNGYNNNWQGPGGMGQKETLGSVSGAVVGGVLASRVGSGSGQLWATGAGVLLGALIGSEIGKSLDRADREYLATANERALEAPVGERISWDNPDSGNYGYVTPTRDGADTYGNYCREYQQTIYVGGRQETGYGTACQRPDGSWEIVS